MAIRKILLLGLSLAINLQNTFAFQQKTPQKQPNILWITCEDMSPHLGSFGEKVAKTPNLDKLAKEAVRYTNVFSTAGVCAPSRSSLITGMYQTSIGTHNMRTLQMPVTQKSSPLPSYSALLPEQVKCFPEYLRKAGYYCTNNEKQDYQFEAPLTVWNENSKTANWQGRQDKNQPFFSVINLMITHESQVFARDKEPITVNPDSVIVPPYYPDNAIIRKDIARFLTNVEIMDRQVGEILQKLKDDELYDNTIIFFYSDHGDGLPFVKRELYDRGLKVPMLIRFPNAQNAGVVDNQLLSFVDFALTVLSLANIPIPKYIQGQAFLGKQKSKTTRKYIYAARDRMDSEYDRVRAVSDGRFKYLKNYQPEKPYYQDIKYRLSQKSMQEILRLKEAGQLNEQQAYWFRNSKPEEELFDTQSDPYEFKNLADNPAYKAKLIELRQKHLEWMKQFGDLGAIPEKELVTSWWQGKDKAPETASPEITLKDGKAHIISATKGASIAYKKHEKEKEWQVYTKPFSIQQGDSLYVVAHRIGYSASKIVKIK
ncbi:sulfatase family protein [Flectobacillus major]|uniref:sulfatase family protein n=1 Tax=Flectobacillus major TaxID=103 RepID=UPI00041A82E8|nr:sulfatase [Flectobacillus major]